MLGKLTIQKAQYISKRNSPKIKAYKMAYKTLTQYLTNQHGMVTTFFKPVHLIHIQNTNPLTLKQSRVVYSQYASKKNINIKMLR